MAICWNCSGSNCEPGPDGDPCLCSVCFGDEGNAFADEYGELGRHAFLAVTGETARERQHGARSLVAWCGAVVAICEAMRVLAGSISCGDCDGSGYARCPHDMDLMPCPSCRDARQQWSETWGSRADDFDWSEVF